MARSPLRRALGRLRLATARLGVALIARSGVARGWFGPWRLGLFDAAERRGLHVLPVHYYSPVPDTRAVPATDAPRFDRGVDFALGAAMETARRLAAPHRETFAAIAARPGGEGRFAFPGSAYHPGEAELLYAMIRETRPARIVEIGCGASTLLIAEALADIGAGDPGFACDYTCIEPFPPDCLRPPPDAVTRLIETGVQAVGDAVFDALGPGDVLFIDSTHVARAGSDVLHEILHVLPRLAPGVLVHLHDVFLPYDYPRDWLTAKRFFWTEQYLLHAWLMDNPRAEVVLPTHLMHRRHGAEMRALFPSLAGAGTPPSAFWLRIR